MQARTLSRNRLAKAIEASQGPRVGPQSQAKERVKKTMENAKGSPKVSKGTIQVSKGSGNGKTLKTGMSDLENLKSETSSEKSGIGLDGTDLYHELIFT